MRAIVIFVASLAVLTPPLLPAVGAERCTSSGFGEESCSTTWNCASGARIYVHAFVDEDGSVEGTAGCQGADNANCTAVKDCYDESSTVATGGAGTCSGTGSGGYWTVLTVACGSTGSFYQEDHEKESAPASPRGDPVAAPLPRHVASSLLLGAPLPPEAEAVLTPEEGAAAYLFMSGGFAAAFVCAAGEGCTPTAPICASGPERSSCRIEGV